MFPGRAGLENLLSEKMDEVGVDREAQRNYNKRGGFRTFQFQKKLAKGVRADKEGRWEKEKTPPIPPAAVLATNKKGHRKPLPGRSALTVGSFWKLGVGAGQLLLELHTDKRI